MGVKKIVKAVRKEKEEKSEAELEAKRQYKEAKRQAKEEKKLAKQEYKEEKRERKEQEKELKQLEKQAERERKEAEKAAKKAFKQSQRELSSRQFTKSVTRSPTGTSKDDREALLLSEEFTAWSDSFVDFDAEMLEAARSDFLDQSVESNSQMSRSEMSGSRGGSQRHRQNFSSRRRDNGGAGGNGGGGSRSRSPCRRRSPSPLRSRSPRNRDIDIPEDAPCSVERFMVDASEQDFAQRRSVSPMPTAARPRMAPRRAKSDLSASTAERNHHFVQDNVTEWSRSRNPDWVPPRASVNPAIRRLRDQQQFEWTRNGAPAPPPVPRKSRSKSPAPAKKTAPSRIPRESISKTRQASAPSLAPTSPKKRTGPTRAASDRTADRIERPKLTVSESVTSHDWKMNSVTTKSSHMDEDFGLEFPSAEQQQQQQQQAEQPPVAKLARPAPIAMRARSVDSALLDKEGKGLQQGKCSLRHAHMVF